MEQASCHWPEEAGTVTSHLISQELMSPPLEQRIRSQRRSFRGACIHGLRLLLLAGIVGSLHLEHRRVQAMLKSQPVVLPDLTEIQPLEPRARALGRTTSSGTEVLDETGATLGRVLQTSPEGDRQIGFSGPTNVLILLDSETRVSGIRILSSRDTREHVSQVQKDRRFLPSFVGKSVEELVEPRQVDGVTGATLTSLAIAEAIRVRLGGMPRGGSLKFPGPPELERVREIFPEAATVEQPEPEQSQWIVQNADGVEIGRFLRTSPAADNIVGYQGPTDMLVALDKEGNVGQIWMNRTFDNEPYCNYLNEDWSFPTLFEGRPWRELGDIDFEQSEFEGISGATMTSQAAVRGILEAIRAELASEESARTPSPEPLARAWTWSLRDLGTGLVVIAGTILGLTQLRGRRRLRLVYQLVVIGYLGLTNGDLLSQAMLLGWAQNGVPWRTTMGMCLLTGAAFLIPVTAGHNIYCSQICPHGAVQQLLRNRLPWRWTLPPGVSRLAGWIPGLLLLFCLMVGMLHLPISLVDLEPFDAWVFRIAGWGTLGVAIVGLIASLFIPMAYCRYGCPTGALLNYVRRHRQSDRLSRGDVAAAVALVASFALWGWHWWMGA
jgi:Na+-translocating ferredoxin:NAD+ oxidoreductase RnfG subunit